VKKRSHAALKSAKGWLPANLCHPLGDIPGAVEHTAIRHGTVSTGRGISTLDDHVLDDTAPGAPESGRLLVFR
jgi:hypothetical protein